jgi:hypothetical protein
MTQRLSAPRICFRPLDRLSLSLCTEPVGLNQIPLGPAPSLHHLRRSMASQFPVAGPLFDGFPGTMGLSDCSAAFMRDYGLGPSPAGLSAELTASHCRALPVPVHGAYAPAAGLWLRGAETGTRSIAPAPYCLPHRCTRSALPRGDFGDPYCACAPLC